MTKVVNMHEAKTHLSRLVEQVLEGEEVVIAKAGKPLVRLEVYRGGAEHRKPGGLKGKIQLKASKR